LRRAPSEFQAAASDLLAERNYRHRVPTFARVVIVARILGGAYALGKPEMMESRRRGG
jgi:hypothetical protein